MKDEEIFNAIYDMFNDYSNFRTGKYIHKWLCKKLHRFIDRKT